MSAGLSILQKRGRCKIKPALIKKTAAFCTIPLYVFAVKSSAGAIEAYFSPITKITRITTGITNVTYHLKARGNFKPDPVLASLR